MSNALPPPPVFVLGMHNAGTTILARLLHHGGVFMHANMNHYESRFFTTDVNDAMILGPGTWANLPLPDEQEILGHRATAGQYILDNWRAAYMADGYDGAGPWGLKDPRLCVLVPLYLELFADARIVIIERNAEDIAASLSHKRKSGVGSADKTHRGRLNDYDHWVALTGAYYQRVHDYADRYRAAMTIVYEQFCAEPQQVARQVLDFCDVPYGDGAASVVAQVISGRIGTGEWSPLRWQLERIKRNIGRLIRRR